ncbi:hypothetical protein Dsin_015874 [Dipteronia sinensis]|uniref:Very-long-chain (3R)-3-hydroxyacyl-CoA dehydratase n=1 Tax=Dipteronia sinensis TaxID=43782 RepID=A0AAE0ACZ2_9ROSI|nr:hypothetical protein Dsin_015874 [Dipteronia sinensis]
MVSGFVLSFEDLKRIWSRTRLQCRPKTPSPRSIRRRFGDSSWFSRFGEISNNINSATDKFKIQTHILVSSLVISWSVTEIIRYSFFGMKEAFGFTPSWFLWLRYSTFLLLYPTGITSEVGLIYFTLPYIKESDKYCIRMPNIWNFSFDYFYAAILVLGFYLPGSPHLYSYMLRQRKKALSKSKRE